MKKNLSINSRDFWVSSSIKEMSNPSSLQFLRDGVLFYEPILIKNLITNWKALKKWNFNYLNEICLNEYQINCTPNGLADSVINENNQSSFYYPAEINMKMNLFLDMLLNKNDEDVIPYLSQQNNNLMNYFPELIDDIETSLPLAIETFGTNLPEALNLWIGDERSVSSLHKDHFENMYAVISGEKIFTLFPPTDIAFLGESVYPTKRYQYVKKKGNNNDGDSNNGGDNFEEIHVATSRVRKEDLISTNEGCPSTELPWIGVDPEDPNAMTLQPSLKYASPIRVKVRAGEVLYIPSMWYHRVTQSCPTIAVNFWYEQQFNFRYVFYQLARSIADIPEKDQDKDE